MKIFVVICLILGSTAILSAQDASPAPVQAPSPAAVASPSEPFLERAPNFARWTITTRLVADPEIPPTATVPDSIAHRRKKKQAEEAEEKSVVEQTVQVTTITKTKSIWFEQTTGNGGIKSERWCLPNMQFTIQSSGPPIVSLPGTSLNSTYLDYSKADFTGFEWLSLNNFRGVEKVSDQECYVFRESAKKDDPNTEAVAYINTATRLPVTLQAGGELYTYRFEVAPTYSLVLPPEIAESAAKWQQSIDQSSLLPAKP